MKSFKYTLGVLFALFLVLSSTLSAFAGNSESPQFYCEDVNGGVWSGSDPYTGTCTFEPGTTESPCEQDQIVVLSYDDGEFLGLDCFEVETGPSTPLDTDDRHSGNSSIPPVLSCTIASGPWRCAYFNEGTCAVNCYIDPHLPSGAEHDLPDGGVYSTLYVNISPDPGGSYVVCMENPDNELFTLYQYLGGVWVPLVVSTNNPVCASATGDGSFYLGS
jgi:hypothetical protein